MNIGDRVSARPDIAAAVMRRRVASEAFKTGRRASARICSWYAAARSAQTGSRRARERSSRSTSGDSPKSIAAEASSSGLVLVDHDRTPSRTR